MRTATFEDACLLIARSVGQDGRAPEDVRGLVLLGSRGGELLQAAFELLPQLERVLVLEHDAGRAEATRQLLQRREGAAPKVTVLGPNQLVPARELVGAYLTIGQFLLGEQLPPSGLTVVLDPDGVSTPEGRVLQAALTDLTRGFSRDFLRHVSERAEFASVLHALGQFLAAQGESYHALKLFSGVPRRSMNAALAGAAFRCVLSLGNRALAEHWLTAMPFDEPSRDALRSQLPADAAGPSSASERLARNLRFLAPRFPEVVAALENASAPDDLFVVRLPHEPWRARKLGGAWYAERSAYPLLVRARGLSFHEENPLTDLPELSAALATCATHGQDHVWIGSWVKHTLVAVNVIAEPSLITLHGWRRVTLLQEPDTAALVTWLGAFELEPWFDLEQVRLSVGPDSGRQLTASLVSNVHQAIPELGIGVQPETRKSVLEGRTRKLARTPEVFAELERRYADHPTRLRGRLAAGQPLTIALMTSRYTTVVQHVTRDMAEGFEQLGHRTVVLSEERAGEGMVAFGVAERLLELEPDVVFSIDHIRPENGALFPPNLPMICWVLDELPQLKDASLIARLGSLDLTYGFNTLLVQGFGKLGYPNMRHLPFAVSPSRYPADPPRADAEGIAFTTHIGQFVADPPGATGLNAVLTRLLDAQPEILLEMPRLAPLLEQALEELELTVSAQAKPHLLYHCLQRARQQDRQRIAERLVAEGLPLTVYGLGWNELPAFENRHGGVVPPGPALREIYRKHRAVLHVNRGCNIHPRVLETMCSGGLVIARWDVVDDLPGETREQLGDALCLFKTHDEMLALFRRALTDDAFRAETVRRGQECVLSRHTYAARAAQIVSDLSELLERHLRGSGVQPSAARVAWGAHA